MAKEQEIDDLMAENEALDDIIEEMMDDMTMNEGQRMQEINSARAQQQANEQSIALRYQLLLLR